MCSIKGIGRRLSNLICKKADIDRLFVIVNFHTKGNETSRKNVSADGKTIRGRSESGDDFFGVDRDIKRYESVFAASGRGFCKRRAKTNMQLNENTWSGLLWFFIDFGALLGSNSASFSIPNRTPKTTRCCIDLGCILVPKMTPF